MRPTHDHLRAQLAEAADHATFRPVDLSQVLRRVERRRLIRRSGLALACCAVLGMGAAALSFTGGATPPSATAGVMPTASAVTSSSPSLPIHRFACGTRVSLASASTTDAVVHFAIGKVARAGDGAPIVTVTLTASLRRTWADPPGPTDPRFQVVDTNGLIVAGQDVRYTAAAGPGPTLTVGGGHGVVVDKQHPYSLTLAPFTVPGNTATPCDGLSWGQLWSHASAYRIIAVVSDWQLGAASRTLSPGATDTLLTAEAPLAVR